MAGAKLKDGIIEFSGANTPGWISNLGLLLPGGGVLTVTDAQGGTLSSDNPGWVTVPSTTAGQLISLKITTALSIKDDSNASSDLTNIGFGITEAADWASDMPFFLYVVNRANSNIDGVDGSSSLFICRMPCLGVTPTSANSICHINTGPVTDDQKTILMLNEVTLANYTNLPCQLIGCFRMRWASSSADWTIQTLNNNDGLGLSQINKTLSQIWDFPTGQKGATAGGYLLANGGTAPAMTSNAAEYMLDINGNIDYWGNIGGDAGTDGSGAVPARLAAPFEPNFLTAAYNHILGSGRITASAIANTAEDFLPRMEHNDATIYLYSGDNSDTVILNSDFGNGGRTIEWYVRYHCGVTT
jgi:hypothetical protein